jgi:hypothetical protein
MADAPPMSTLVTIEAGSEQPRDPERYAAFASSRRNDAETDWPALAAANMWRPPQTALFLRIVDLLLEVFFLLPSLRSQS